MTTRRQFLKGAAATGIAFCSCGMLDAARAQPKAPRLPVKVNGKRVLFSEIKEGLHMVLVTTDEARGQSRDVYVPPGERSMVHHSYLSPDGRWVLMVVIRSSSSSGEVMSPGRRSFTSP